MTNELIQPSGAFQSITFQENNLHLQFENRQAQLALYEDEIIRFQYTAAKNFKPNPYSVVGKTLPVEKTRVAETADFLVFNGNELSFRLSKKDASFQLNSSDGTLLVETEQGLPPVSVQATEQLFFKLKPEMHFFGLGEKTGPMDKKGRFYTNWNTDSFAYGTSSDPLYMSIPFFIVYNEGRFLGLFLDNAGRTDFNFGASNNRFFSLKTYSGDMDLYFIPGQSALEIIARFTKLTGKAPLPPKWALGLQQCRYSYYPDSEVLNIAQNYRNRKIPADVIYLDIHYMQDYKVFTWNKEKFPAPESMIQKLESQGFKVVVIIDPGVKVEQEYHAYESGKAENVFCKWPDGTDFSASVWPGLCHFPDFTNAATRNWWANQFKNHIETDKIAGFWTDMNEPATWGQAMPDVVMHQQEGENKLHFEVHNNYGMQMARATREAQEKFNPNVRPFVLTRAGNAGIHRYAAAWTGDNVATDEHMMLGMRLVNNLCLSGVSFCGMDIGGFVGNASATLFARWLSLGVFSPLFRIHSMIDSHENDPWSYGETIEYISKNYIQLRYRLLPYLYKAFRDYALHGTPICKPLTLQFPENQEFLDGKFQHEYFFGEQLLVAPVESYKDYVKVMLPGKANWFHLFTDEKFEAGMPHVVECPIDRLPVFIESGTAIFMQSLVQHTMEKAETLELHLYNGKGVFETSLYEDDGKSNQYLENNFYEASVKVDFNAGNIFWSKINNTFSHSYQHLDLVFHGFDTKPAFSLNGKDLATTASTFSMLDGIPNFDPFQNLEKKYQLNIWKARVSMAEIG